MIQLLKLTTNNAKQKGQIQYLLGVGYYVGHQDSAVWIDFGFF